MSPAVYIFCIIIIIKPFEMPKKKFDKAAVT